MRPRENLSLIDVIENLNTIVEAESLDNVEVTDNFLFIYHETPEEINPATENYFMPAGYNEETFDAIKATFGSAYKYLQSFELKIEELGETKTLLDGIKIIVVLIGEAKKKFEKFDKIIAEKISELPEYQEIESFYRGKIVPEVKKKEHVLDLESDESWSEFLALTKEHELEESEGVHILDDLETVRNDHFYELFYIKNEAGQSFYTDNLVRNIKLAVDFGEFAKEKFDEDPLVHIKNWEDRSFHILAKRIFKRSKKEIDAFYKSSFQKKDIELVSHLHNALMAIMLASNSKNMLRHFSIKGCGSYFFDFQVFLRKALNDKEYQKFILYASSALQESPFFADLVNLIYALSYEFFTLSPGRKEIITKMVELVGKSHEKKNSSFLEASYKRLAEILAKHPSGPVLKAVDVIRSNEEKFFDPLMMGNIPEVEGWLNREGREIQFLRMPSPTQQYYINEAIITEEFKTFLYYLSEKKEEERLLVVNFQDKTSWKEHSRSQVIEEFGRNALFTDVLTVITLTKDTDFYFQRGVYEHVSNAKEFIHMFIEHLQDEGTGYYFPSEIRKLLFPYEMKKIFEDIHKNIFEGKKELSLHNRLDFIELAYIYIELRIIDETKATMVTHLSKDGLDTSAPTTAELMALFNVEDKNHLLYTFLGPTLMQRERELHIERFERALSVIKLMEGHKGLKGKFITPQEE